MGLESPAGGGLDGGAEARLARLVRRAAPPAAGSWREGLLAAAAIFALAAALLWDAVALGRALLPVDLIYSLDPVWRGLPPAGFRAASNPLLSDQVHQAYPWRAYLHYWLSRGELPLWNSSILGGASFVGNDQSALFNPLSLPSYLLPLAAGFTLAAVARLLVAGVSTYGYLRVAGRSVGAAYLGAIAFTLSGFLVAWLGHPHANVAVWLPTILLLLELVFRSRRRRWPTLLALAMGAQLLGGHVETSFHILLASGAYALFLAGRAWSRGDADTARRGLGLAALGALLGLGVGAIQVLPFLEQVRGSTIVAERAAANASSPLFHPGFWRELATLPTLLFPNLLGSPTEAEYWAFTVSYNEYAAYVGTIPLLLAVAGAARARRDGRAAFWLVAGGLSLAVACRLPLLEAINHLPLFDLAANGRLRLVFSFAAAALAAAGLDWLLSRLAASPDGARDLRRFAKLAAAVGLLSLAALLGAYLALGALREQLLSAGRRYVEASVYGQPGLPYSLDHYLAKADRYYDVTVQRFAPTVWRTYLPALSALALAGVTWLAFRGRINRRQVAAALPIAAAVELIAFGAGYNPTVDPARVFPTTPAVEFLREHAGSDRVVGLGFALTPNSAMIWGLQDLRGYDVVRPARTWDLLREAEGRVPFGD